jgi:hypothetical protein
MTQEIEVQHSGSYVHTQNGLVESLIKRIKLIAQKRKVFTYAMPTPPRTFPIGFKWVFVRKRNENNEVVRYKTRLVAQGFT